MVKVIQGINVPKEVIINNLAEENLRKIEVNYAHLKTKDCVCTC